VLATEAGADTDDSSAIIITIMMMMMMMMMVVMYRAFDGIIETKGTYKWSSNPRRCAVDLSVKCALT